MKGYYPFYAWSKLVDCGTEVACTVSESRGEKTAAATGVSDEKKVAKVDKEGFRAVAAKGKDGACALFVTRYSEDNNVTDTAKVYLKLPPLDPRRVRCHVTDAVRIYTEVPLARSEDGSYLLRMQPNSFALVEW